MASPLFQDSGKAYLFSLCPVFFKLPTFTSKIHHLALPSN